MDVIESIPYMHKMQMSVYIFFQLFYVQWCTSTNVLTLHLNTLLDDCSSGLSLFLSLVHSIIMINHEPVQLFPIRNNVLFARYRFLCQPRIVKCQKVYRLLLVSDDHETKTFNWSDIEIPLPFHSFALSK